MATFYLPSSGGYNTANNNYIKYRIKIEEGTLSGRTRPITVSVQFYRTNDYETRRTGKVYCKVDRTEYNQSFTNNDAIKYNTYTTLFTKTINVTYDGSGVLKIPIYAKWVCNEKTNDYYSEYQGGNVSLTSIDPTVLTVKYYSNYATESYSNVENQVGADRNVILKTSQFKYGETYPTGHWDYLTLGLKRAGYNTTGYWGTSPDGGVLVPENPPSRITGQALAEELGLDISKSNQEINLYAQWTINLTVAYMMNDGTDSVYQRDTLNNTWFNLPIDNPKQEYRVFIHWNTEPDGSGTTYTPDHSYDITEPLTLYAIWYESELHLTYHSNYADEVKHNGVVCNPLEKDIYRANSYNGNEQPDNETLGIQDPNGWYFRKNGYLPTGYWGTSPDGGVLVSSDSSFDTIRDLFDAFQIANKHIEHIELDIYLQWEAMDNFAFVKSNGEWMPHAAYVKEDGEWVSLGEVEAL